MDDKERAKDAIDIVSYIQKNGITLKKEGRLFVGLCPFHTEKHGSFTVYPDTKSYHCFGCHVDGDVFSFAMKRNHWTFPEALEELARYANITLEPLSPGIKEKQDKRERLYALLNHAMQFYSKQLYDNDTVLDYLVGERKLSNMLDQLGYAPDEWQRLYPYLKACGYSDDEMIAAGVCKRSDKSEKMYDFFRGRVMIPIKDHNGRIVSFGGRTMGDEKPKYLNGPETDIFSKSKIVYGFDTTSKANAAQMHVLVEGYMDVLQSRQNGIFDTVACMGVGLSDEQLDILCKNGTQRLVFCLDNDETGNDALRRLVTKHIHHAAAKGVTLYAMSAPYGKDADDTLRKDPAQWQPAVDAARPVVEVLIKRELAKLGESASGAQKSNLARELLPILKSDDPFIQQENIAILSRQTGIPVDNLEAWLIGLSQIRVMPKAATATIQEPPLETAILWGIIFNEHDRWLQRANGALICLSPLDKPLMYAFAPLNAQDFTHAPYQELMTLISKDMDNLQSSVIDTPLYEVYRRIIFDAPISSMFAADVPKEQPRDTCEEFIDKVLRLRQNRLKADMTARNHFSEAMRGVALIQQKRESQIGG